MRELTHHLDLDLEYEQHLKEQERMQKRRFDCQNDDQDDSQPDCLYDIEDDYQELAYDQHD